MIDIAVSNLNKYFGENHILKGLSFEVYEGEKVGLLGKNGAGKTTLFKIITGEETCESGGVSVPSSKRIGFLEQIPEYPEGYTVLDVLKSAIGRIYELAGEIRLLEVKMQSDCTQTIIKRYGELQNEFEAIGGYTADSFLARICNGLSIDSDMQGRKFALLSGGEKTRVNLGRLLLKQTDILLLDEPTNHLDIKSAEWLEEFVEEYKGTVLVISHDRYFLDKTVKRIIEIEDGKAEYYEGNYSFYVNEKEQRYLLKLQQFEQEQKKINQLAQAAKKLHEWANNADNPALHKRAFAIEKRIERIDKTDRPLKEKQLSVGFTENNHSGREVILFKDLYKSYGSKTVIDGISLSVRPKEKIALLGSNGCGKTTLIRIITGEEIPETGTVRIGNSITYGILPQIVTFDKPDLTVIDTVRYELELSEQSARNRLAAFHFKGKDVFKCAGALSGGEKSRLKLCILMYRGYNLLILDEPTNHLDIQTREWIEDAVSGFEGTVLFVSHDRYFIRRFADRVWEMEDGRIMDFTGSYDEYRAWKQKRGKNTAPRPVVVKKRIGVLQPQSEDTSQKESIMLENKILGLEDNIRLIEKEMQEKASDYEKLDSLYNEKLQLDGELEVLYSKWDTLSK